MEVGKGNAAVEAGSGNATVGTVWRMAGRGWGLCRMFQSPTLRH